MTSPDELFPVGTLVWAKVQGFSAWPAKVEAEGDLPDHVLQAKPPSKAVPVFFFGSHEFGWIQTSALQDYHAFKEILSKKNKSKQFVKGLEEIEDPSLWPEMSSFQSFVPVEVERKRKSTSTSGQAKKQKTERKVQIGSDPKDRLMKLRLKLQMFLQQTEEYSAHDYQKANQYLTETEKVQMDVNLFKETKIGKVIKHLSKKSIPQYEISARCKALTEKWIMELQDSISLNTPTVADEKMPNLDHDGDVDLKSPVSPSAKVVKQETASATVKPQTKPVAKQIPVAAVNPDAKKVSAPVTETNKPASPKKPASPAKDAGKPASPVKEIVKPVEKVASPTKSVTTATVASPGKTLVSPASPVKEQVHKTALPVKVGSPIKETVKVASPVKDSVKPTSPVKETVTPKSPVTKSINTASPVKEVAKPVSPVKLASPVKETKALSPVKKLDQPESVVKDTVSPTSPVKQALKPASPVKEVLTSGSPLKETIKPGNEIHSSPTKSKPVGV